MKRKNQNARKSVDLRGLDPTSPKYWEEVLRRENLGMSRGMMIGNKDIAYVGTASVVESIDNRQYDAGAVRPKKTE